MIAPPVVDGAFARWLATRAGEALLAVRADLGHADPGALKAAGDKVSHELLRTELARWRPADAVLSEEDEGARLAWTADLPGSAPARLDSDRVWIIDPLDGTREYSEEDRTDWAVHVALWSRSAPAPHGLLAGAVALPAQERVIATDYPPGYPARFTEPVDLGTAVSPPGIPGQPTATGTGGPIRLVVSRSRPPVFLTDLAADLGAELVPMGSAGAKIAAVVSGDVDAYVHAGGQYEWDSAAPVAVATTAGLHASRIDGATLAYNQADPRLPDLVVCREDLAPRLLAALQQHLPVA